MTRRLDPIALYHSAIINADGTVNVGYLVLFRLLRTLWVVLGVLTITAIAAVWAAWPNADEIVKVIQAYGIACGVAAGSMFGPALAACGVFLWGDSKTPQASRAAAAPIPRLEIPDSAKKTD